MRGLLDSILQLNLGFLTSIPMGLCKYSTCNPVTEVKQDSFAYVMTANMASMAVNNRLFFDVRYITDRYSGHCLCLLFRYSVGLTPNSFLKAFEK